MQIEQNFRTDFFYDPAPHIVVLDPPFTGPPIHCRKLMKMCQIRQKLAFDFPCQGALVWVFAR